MKLAEKLGLIQPSATLALNAKTLALKAAGVNVTSLAVGEPDFATPEHICKAAHEAVDQGFTKYTAAEGIMELRQAVCGYFARQYGVNAKGENVIITNGGKQSLYQLFVTLLNPGDIALVPAPYWTSYPEMILLAGGQPHYVPTRVENGFRLAVEDLDKAPKAKILVLNSPSNPTGVAYTIEELHKILEWAQKNNVFVVADEIYDQLTYAPSKAVSASVWWQEHQENVAVVNGVAKSFAMTGWRIGYTLAHKDIIKEMSKIQGQVTSSVNSIAQKAALAALSGSYACVESMRSAFMRRRDMAHAEIASWPGVICPKPEGAFYLFPDVSALFCPEYSNDLEFSAMLLEKAQVAVMPGSAFGNAKCIRISYAVSDKVLAEALQKIRAVI